MLQAVHAEEKHEMASICEEKLQLSECLERMSTEIINLNNSIADKDKQKENPHLAFEDGVALENMLDEIERGHRRAEELETKIERLQVCGLHFALQCLIKLQNHINFTSS